MNNPHQNARLTVHSREQIVARVIAGQSAAEVAAAFAVSLRTVRKWLARFRAGERATLSDHASAPAHVAGRLGGFDKGQVQARGVDRHAAHSCIG